MQVAYAAVTLAGYVTYFAPDLLQLSTPPRIAADGRRRNPAPAPATAQPPAAQPVVQDACKASDQGSPSPRTHSMQLRERKLQNAANVCMEGNIAALLNSGMPATQSRAADRLLEPRTLRLCGSFTLQARHHAALPLYDAYTLMPWTEPVLSRAREPNTAMDRPCDPCRLAKNCCWQRGARW